LSYNAYIHKESGEIIWNASSNEDGYKLIPVLGNASQNTSWTIDDLESGYYVCGVQAIDHNFEGSAFTDEVEFTIGTINIENIEAQTVNVFPNPSSGVVNIIFDNDIFNQLIISNILGKEIYTTFDPPKNSQFDFSAFGCGIYFISLISDNSNLRYKLIIN